MTNEIIELLEQSEHNIISINKPNTLGLNKNHAKDPFRSKKFIKSYENICDCSKTVYIVVTF